MAQDVYASSNSTVSRVKPGSKYEKKIELQSFSWGASNSSSFASGTGGSTAKGQIHDISVSMYTSRASLRLMEGL